MLSQHMVTWYKVKKEWGVHSFYSVRKHFSEAFEHTSSSWEFYSVDAYKQFRFMGCITFIAVINYSSVMTSFCISVIHVYLCNEVGCIHHLLYVRSWFVGFWCLFVKFPLWQRNVPCMIVALLFHNHHLCAVNESIYLVGSMLSTYFDSHNSNENGAH